MGLEGITNREFGEELPDDCIQQMMNRSETVSPKVRERFQNDFIKFLDAISSKFVEAQMKTLLGSFEEEFYSHFKNPHESILMTSTYEPCRGLTEDEVREFYFVLYGKNPEV